MCAGCLTPAPVADTFLGGRSGCTAPRWARAGHLQSFSSAARAVRRAECRRDARGESRARCTHERYWALAARPSWPAAAARVALRRGCRQCRGAPASSTRCRWRSPASCMWRSSRDGPRSSPQDGQVTRALHTRPRLNRRPRSRARGGRPTTASSRY